ncbi:MAG: amidohydrolase family protein [Acidobacteria bacterium]|nr:amidohydrolase family protein [Acidobacteriota bacterium]
MVPPDPIAAADVIRNVTVVDVENSRVLHHQDIVMDGGRIVRVSPNPARVERPGFAIDGSDLVAVPGFVNTHTHLWQHVAKGFRPDGKLQEWVSIYDYCHLFEPEELYRVVLAAANQALLSGVTTVSDYASMNFQEFALEQVVRALKDAGLEGDVVWWHQAVFLPDDAKVSEIRRLRRLGGSAVDVWMGFGTLSYFDTPTIYDGILLAKQLGLRMTEHTMENVQEQRDLYTLLDAYVQRYGERLDAADFLFMQQMLGRGSPSQADNMLQVSRLAGQMLSDQADRLTAVEKANLQALQGPETISPVPLLEWLGGMDGYVAIHAVWPEETDRYIFRAHGAWVAHCPDSNQYLSSGVAPILRYLDEGIPVTIGTDGAASNDGIDFFQAMKATWNLQKIQYLNTARTKAIKAWDVLRAATLGGAEALGLGAVTGSIQAGKEADLVLFSRKRLGLAPVVQAEDVDNLVPLLIYSCGPRDVDTVLSDGRVVVREGRLLRYSESVLARQLSEIATNLVKRNAQGKIWVESDAVAPGRPWLRYRSVRQNHTVHLVLTNRGAAPVFVDVAMSADMFGGDTPYVFKPETLVRFPLDAPEGFWQTRQVIPPGGSLQVEKSAGGSEYTLSVSGSTPVRRPCTESHQLLVITRPAVMADADRPGEVR